MPVSSSPQNAKNQGHGTTSTATQHVQEAASSATQKAGELASQAGQKAQNAAQFVSQKAQDAASTAKEKADDAISTVGQKMTSLADTLREQAPHEGFLGTTATSVADNLRAGGQYLQQHHMDEMMSDMASLMRRFPVQSVLIGFGVGFLMGNALSRR